MQHLIGVDVSWVTGNGASASKKIGDDIRQLSTSAIF